MAYRYKRGNIYWLQYRENGKRKFISLATGDLKLAKYKQREIENKLVEGSSPFIRAKSPVKAAVEEYIDYIRDTIGQRQLKEEKSQIDRFIDYSFINYVSQINDDMFKKFLRSLTSKKTKNKPPKAVSQRTKNGYIVTMKKFLKFCRKKKYISNNPLEDITVQKLPKNPPTFFDDKTTEKFLQAAFDFNKEYYYLCITGILAGMRIQELLNLEWQDFEFGKKDENGKWGNGVIRILNKNNFKTKNRSYRVVPLAMLLQTSLEPIRRKKGYCFFKDDDFRLSYWKHRKKFRKIARIAKINLPEYKAFHILRHTFGTRHGRAGRSIYKIAEWLGHGSVETSKKYTHLEQADSEIDRFPEKGYIFGDTQLVSY